MSAIKVQRPLLAALAILFAAAAVAGTPAATAATATEVASKCLDAIRQVHSYDVRFTAGTTWMGPRPPASPATWHDVFAFGAGRRVEVDLGDASMRRISVITWEAAAAHGGTTAIAERFQPWECYFTCFNPASPLGGDSDVFLSDLLASPAAKIDSLDGDRMLHWPGGRASTGLIGVRVAVPQRDRVVHLWIDPQHGYMPGRIELFSLAETTMRLPSGKKVFFRPMDPTGVIVIERFKKLAGGMWVPTAARYWWVSADRAPWSGSDKLGAGDRVVPHSENLINIDGSASTWNGPVNPAQFQAASLPCVNNEFDGWAECLGERALPTVQDIDQDMAEIREQVSMRVGPKPDSTRLVWMFVNIAVILFLATLLYFRYYRRPAKPPLD